MARACRMSPVAATTVGDISESGSASSAASVVEWPPLDWVIDVCGYASGLLWDDLACTLPVCVGAVTGRDAAGRCWSACVLAKGVDGVERAWPLVVGGGEHIAGPVKTCRVPANVLRKADAHKMQMWFYPVSAHSVVIVPLRSIPLNLPHSLPL